MVDWLYEGRLSVYILLGVTALALLYLAWQTRRRSFFIASGLVVGLIGLYFLLDKLVETDREQVRRKLLAMADAVKDHDTDGVVSLLSSQFSVWGMNRAEFRKYVDTALHDGSVDELTIWDIQFPREETPPPEGTLKVAFSARPKSGRYAVTPHFLCDALFVRESDGEWRMKEFKYYNPLTNSHLPLERPR